MSDNDTEDLLASLKAIAEKAGGVILGYYGEEEGPEVRRKADSSPVTVADEAAEALILEELARLTPTIPVIAEESVAAGRVPQLEPGGMFWLVDPLDGTKEFISRNGEFTVNIGLIQAGVPVAGVVHAPARAMTWTGAREPSASRGYAAFSQTGHAEMAIEVRLPPSEGLTVIASRSHANEEALEGYMKGRKIAERLSAGSSLKFCLLASGKADLYPRFGRTMEWDTAAGQAVLMSAGGEVRTLDGEPLTYGKPGFENPHFIATGKTAAN